MMCTDLKVCPFDSGVRQFEKSVKKSMRKYIANTTSSDRVQYSN